MRASASFSPRGPAAAAALLLAGILAPTAPPALAAPLRLSGEALVGVGLDYGGFGDYDHYLVVEPAGAIDGRAGWFAFGLRGSLTLDALRFYNQDFAWDLAGTRPGAGLYLALPVGYQGERVRVRLGPWLRTDARGAYGRRTSFFPWGAGDLRVRFRRFDLVVDSFSHLPIATSGSGLHLGVHLPGGYGRARAATWTLYVSSPLLVGVASRHLFHGSDPRHPFFLQLSAGFDFFQGAKTSQGPALELGAALGWLFGGT
jgi:hypothetical protein